MHEIIVAGGMESMTNAPHLLPKSREGFKYGDTTLVDSMAYDALYDQATQQAMGGLTEQCNADGTKLTPRGAGRVRRPLPPARRRRRGRTASSTTRSCRSRSRSARATRSWSTHDEGVRGDTTAESLGKLRPAFSKDGTITAGSASQISDGACAVVVMSKAKAEELGLSSGSAEIGAHGQVAGPDSTLQMQPANATSKALEKEGISIGDVDLVEFNEAFAAVGIESARELGLPEDKVNVNGGAIALGHPVGMSGARIVLHLALESQAPRWRHRRRRPVRRRWPGRRPGRQGARFLTSDLDLPDSSDRPAGLLLWERSDLNGLEHPSLWR